MSNSRSLQAGLGVVVLIFSGYFAGDIEGYIFPVVTDFEIERTEPAENGSTRMWGAFDLHREACAFKGIDWQLKGAVRNVTAALTFESGTSERTGKTQEFGPWRLQLTEHQTVNMSQSIVFHQCPWRPWITVTKLYS